MVKILHDIRLKAYNTFGIDVRANSFAEISSINDLYDLITSGEIRKGKFLILGGGSNLLFKKDYEGLVVKIGLKGIEKIFEDEYHVYVKSMAGEEWDALVAWCVKHGWGGLENLSGIPGSVGAGPIQNIGAYGTELKDHFHELEALEIKTGKLSKFNLKECAFGYRDSIFKRRLKGKFIILSVTLRLNKIPEVNLSYGALREKMEVGVGEGESVGIDIKRVREAVLEIRREKLPDPAVLGNAGSFFKNPVVSYSALEKLRESFPGIIYYEFKVQSSDFKVKVSDLSAPGHRPPVKSSQFPVPSSQSKDKSLKLSADWELQTANCKLSAGWLIEHCGWKGFREGDAGVHKDQALVLVNYEKATGQEILDLARRIQVSVLENFGVELEPEVNVVS